ncbi:arylsulfatase [Candidatus Sumerlaeota bacterium]|nr:arylsulfatase [Candidatus Sumerlaeota bacterium]
MAAAKTSRRAFLGRTMAWGSAMALSRWPLAMAAQSAKPPVSSRAQKPNFLIIIADDMGYSDAGCYGGEIATPNLDALANGGVRFGQCYSTGRCWPSRACLLTGYYPQQVRMDPPQGPLPRWTRVAPHYLKPAGYRCYVSGKWHLMGAPKPIADGAFDRSYILQDHNRYFAPKDHELDDKKLAAIEDGTNFYVTTAIAQYALDFLKEHADKHRQEPFYCYLAFTSPHFPLHALQEDIARCRDRYLEGWDVIRERRWKRLRQMGLVNCDLPPLEPVIPDWNFPGEKLREMIGPDEVDHAVLWKSLTDEQKKFQATKMAIHAAMIERMDREIGRVLDQVKAMGAFDNTVIFFVSDNGASAEQIIRGDMHDPSVPPGSARSYLCLGPGWSSASNSPLRLHKSWVHEGGISSPLIVHWPAGLAARGEVRQNPCHFIDILPTVLDLAGCKDVSPKWNGETAPPLPGKSIVPAFARDGAVEHEFLYFHHLTNRAIRMGDWKLVAMDDKPWELYDLKTDRCELKNLADKYPERAREMAARWQNCEDEFPRQAGPPPEKSVPDKAKKRGQKRDRKTQSL